MGVAPDNGLPRVPGSERDTPAEEALARGIRRDIEEYGLDPSRTTAAWAEWSAWERSALARDNRKLRADVVV